MRVFWSWQSDLEGKCNQHLIKGAIEDALKIIVVELELEESDRPDIDHDTKGAAGAVDIAKTILEKIETAAAFIADVTPIAKTAKGKHLPNPNVMIELGFALKAPGEQQVITVLNKAFGAKPDDLPFDLRNRRCMTYSCPDDAKPAERKKIRKGLAKDLASALLDNLPKPPPFDYSVVMAASSPDGSIWASGLEEMVFTGAFQGEEDQRHFLAEGPRSYIRIVPSGWNTNPPSLLNYQKLQSGKPVCPSNGASSGSWGASDDGMQNFWFKGAHQHITSITKFYEVTGEVWACRVGTVIDDRVAWIPIVRHWEEVLRSANEFFDSFGAKPARHCEVGFVGMRGFKTPGSFIHERQTYRKGEMRLSREYAVWNEEAIQHFLLDATNEIRGNLMLPPVDWSGLIRLYSS